MPNIYSRNGKIIYEIPDGEIIVKENSKCVEIDEAECEKFDERLKNYSENPDERINWKEPEEKINTA